MRGLIRLLQWALLFLLSNPALWFSPRPLPRGRN